MKTAIICFDGGNEYTKIRQLKQILKEEKEQRGILCKDYDELDRLAPILKENGITKIIILHEDKNIDRFERAAHQEFDSMFENVEICIDYSKERLFEGDRSTATGAGIQQQQSGQVTKLGQYQGKEKDITTFFIFPTNPLVKGAAGIIQKSFAELAKSKASPTTAIINISSLACEQDGYWGMSAIKCGTLLKGVTSDDTDYAFARSWAGLSRIFPSIIASQGKGGQPIQVIGPKNLLAAIKYPYQPTEDLSSFGTNAGGLGTQAFALGAKIFNDQNSTKIDEGKIQAWQDPKMIAKTSFLIKCLGDIQWAVENKGKDESTQDGESFLNKALEKFGVYQDLADINKHAREGGMALLMDAASLVADKLSRKKEKEQSKTAPLISHPEWEKFADCFDSEDNFVEA